MEIRIYKAKRELELWTEGNSGLYKKRTFKISLGFVPVGEKHRNGDGRTPEGAYYICTKNPESQFTLFLGISYPGEKDAEYGLKNGFLNREEYDQIIDALSRKKRPPWETEAGGKIGLHGKGVAQDWTAGCIALADEDIRAIWEEVELETPVLIYP